uniref:ABC transporter domain-containing protein n=1 Tax=viral metagenome TaxID=1070528 RepID=A0A6C0AU86_9ZZZZ|tara:strand:- start:2819 stop:3649 length:831 start_codon:yes stop_codon:yes gene_type:complete
MKCVEINNLTFKYENTFIFNNFSLDLYSNNCYVLSGLNGCGKSTLLKIIGGKTLCEAGAVKVLSKDPFRDTTSNSEITFINNDWGTRTVAYTGYNMPIQSSLKVKEMMIALKQQFPERNQELIEVLGINPEWSLNGVSEGQRKRVQLYLSLLKPFKVCLLDEITVNLDLLVKDKLMKYLKKESLERECCIVYVTHIFDGLEKWGTHLIHLKKAQSSQKTEITKISHISNIYDYLLHRFQLEEPYEIELEANSYEKRPKKNAGGYSNGVLAGNILFP